MSSKSVTNMNHTTPSSPTAASGMEKRMSEKSSCFMMENLLKPDGERRVQEPKETPSKMKALSMAAHLAGLKFPMLVK